MRNQQLLPALLTTLLLFSCGSDERAGSGGEKTSAGLREEFLLGFGETVYVSPLKLEFTTLVEDSRCPASAICVWEGNARILVTVTRGGTTSVLALNTNGTLSTSDLFQGYFIQLRKLDPYPETPAGNPADRYTATLFVDQQAVITN